LSTKNKIAGLFTCIILLLNNNCLNAQELGIKLLTHSTPDSILLRWAPVNNESWQMANQYGYIINRYTLVRKNKVLKEREKVQLSMQVIKPAPIEIWEQYSDNKYVSIGAECLYGSTYTDVPVNGNPMVAYQKYKEQIHRFGFAMFAFDQSIIAAELAGLYFSDVTAHKDEKYLYEIYISAPDTIKVDTAYSFTGISEYIPLTKPIELKAEWNDKEVSLSWDFISLKHLYNSYIIEKSDDGGKNYNRISENAVVQVADSGVTVRNVYFTDSLLNNDIVYYYRIRGINAFGMLSPPSDSVFGNGTLPITLAPIIYSNNVIDNKFVELKWEYPQEMNKYINGFKIYRSDNPKTKKEVIYNGIDSEARVFIDTTSGYNNYYLISVYNDRTEKLSAIRTFVQRIDSFPPDAPIKLSAVIDSLGVVTLKWKANTENDIKGYRVYSANDPKFEFKLVTNNVIADTFFIEKINLNTLTEKIFYKVRAVDLRENHSSLSDVIEVIRPDIIPPVRPIIKDIVDVNNLPQIVWLNSTSSDVVSHIIYRKPAEDSVYVLLDNVIYNGDKRTTYIDKKIESGSTYHYYIVAVDDAGLISEKSNYGYYQSSKESIEKIKLKKREYSDNVKLLWSIKTDKKIEKILIYRSVNNMPLTLYANTKDENYTDNKLSLEKEYKYAIKVVYTDGTKSALSNYIKIKI